MRTTPIVAMCLALVGCPSEEPTPVAPTEPTVVEQPTPAPEAPTPAEAPPNPETEPSQASDPCDGLSGSTFTSVEKATGGRGGGKRHWTIHFEGDAYRWRHTDVVRAGRWACEGGRITVGNPEVLSEPATLAADGILTWNDRAYRRGKPPVVSPKPDATPMPVPKPTTVTIGDDGRIPSYQGGDAAKACTQDSDCVVSTVANGTCCALSCGPSAAWNTDFLPTLTAYRDRMCDGWRGRCPPVGCALQEYTARCRANRCVAEKGFGL